MKHKKVLKQLIEQLRDKYNLYHIEIQTYDYKTDLNAYAVYIQEHKDDKPFKLCNKYFTNKELREFINNLLQFSDQIRIGR